MNLNMKNASKDEEDEETTFDQTMKNGSDRQQQQRNSFAFTFA
jgi:hypothetical protein